MGPEISPRPGVLPGRDPVKPFWQPGSNQSPPPKTVPQALHPSDLNQFRSIGLKFALGFAFLRFSLFHESVTMLVNIPLYLALIVGTLALVTGLVGGGLQRTYSHRSAIYWTGFLFIFGLSALFSSWRAESVTIFTGYLRNDFAMLYLLGGLIVTWEEFVLAMDVFAISAAVNIAASPLFSNFDEAGRLVLQGGTIGNSNDLAAHVLLLLPFLLWVIITPHKFVYKLGSLGFLLYGFMVCAKTASRGAMIAFAVGMLLILFRGPGKLRITLTLAGALIVFGSISFLPRDTIARYLTVSGEPSDQDLGGASGSSDERRYLLETSLLLTLKHPALGVGPGTFSSYAGGRAQEELGRRGTWQETHNSYTQVSSEMGIPAALFFIGAIVSAILTTNRCLKAARKGKLDLAVAMSAFCLMLALVMFAVAMTFLTLAYRFYMPALCGLAISLDRVVKRKLAEAPAPPIPAHPFGISVNGIPRAAAPLPLPTLGRR